MTAMQPAARRASPLAPERPRLGERMGVAARRATRLLLLGAALLAVAGLGIFQVLQTSNVATLGYELRNLERERAALSADVRLLEAKVAERSNLERVYREAVDRLGMVPPERTIRVDVGAPRPDDVPLPRRYVPPVETVEEPPREAWWERLLTVLPGLR